MLSTGRNAPGAYRGMFHGIQHILHNEGLRGFWRGLLPSLLGITHGAIQFTAYEELKNYRREQRNSTTLSNVDTLVLSSVSKIFAGSITYPYQVLRSRLQMYDAESAYRGVFDAIRQMWRHEGIRGFYKG
jgi:solute carrier family 25 (mitochondrial folate transporter), member 32